MLSSFESANMPQARGEDTKSSHALMSKIQERCCYLVKGAHSRLENQVGVEEEGSQERLRVGRQLGQDARQQQVDVKRVRQHVLHAGQQHTHKGACRDESHSLHPDCHFFLSNSAATEGALPLTHR